MTDAEMETKIQEAEEKLKECFCSKDLQIDYEESVGLAKRANAIFMVHVEWGENYDADTETLAAELDRIEAENAAKMKKADWLYLANHCCYSAMERSLARPHYLKMAAKCKE